MIQLVYISAAAVPFDEASLDALLDVSRRNNEAADITGLLVFHEGSFLQVLEGEPEAVMPLFDKIGADRRHAKVTKLLARTIERREFGDWRMGFVRNDPRHRKDPPGFARFMEEGLASTSVAPDADRVRRVLEQFRDRQWRQRIEGR